MESGGDSSNDSEERLFEDLKHVIGGSSEDHIASRIQLLEDLLNKVKNNLLVNSDKAVDILLDVAISRGDAKPESSLIRDSLILLIRGDAKHFAQVLAKVSHGHNVTILLSSMILELDYNKKREAVKVLVDFLAARGALDQKGTKEVYETLLKLGKEHLAREIVNASSPYLDSSLSKLPAIMYSLQLCSKFADATLTPKMLNLLEKALKGYFHAYNLVVCREICGFIERTHDPRSLTQLLEFSKDPNSRGNGVISAIASVLDSNSNLVEYVLEALYDTRDAIISDTYVTALENTKSRVEPRRLLNALSRGGVFKYPLNWRIKNIVVRHGDRSKPLLFELLKDDATYEFALDCLRSIGIRRDEISSIFLTPPMLQIYNFFYGNRRKNPRSFDRMLEKVDVFNEQIPGKPTMLDFFVLNLLSCFNLVTMQVDSSGMEGADVVCFDQETMEMLVLGCTTGTIKNDLSNMHVLLKDMENEIPEIFKICKLTPVVLTSRASSFSKSDIRDANHIGAILLGKDDIDKIVEMLSTGRKSRDLLQYMRQRMLDQKSSEDTSSRTY